MKRFATIAAAFALTACATTGTFKQNMFTTFGAYRIALAGALDYARSPTSDIRVVRKLNDVNQSPATRETVRYARAFVACGAVSAGKVGDIDCTLFDFRPQTATGYIITLRSVVATLNGRVL